jgi:hypothetical protein
MATRQLATRCTAPSTKAAEIAKIINKYQSLGYFNAEVVEETGVQWAGGCDFGSAGWAYTFGMYELPDIKAIALKWYDPLHANARQRRRVVAFCEEMHRAFQGWLIEPFDSYVAHVVERD